MATRKRSNAAIEARWRRDQRDLDDLAAGRITEEELEERRAAARLDDAVGSEENFNDPSREAQLRRRLAQRQEEVDAAVQEVSTYSPDRLIGDAVGAVGEGVAAVGGAVLDNGVDMLGVRPAVDAVGSAFQAVDADRQELDRIQRQPAIEAGFETGTFSQGTVAPPAVAPGVGPAVSAQEGTGLSPMAFPDVGGVPGAIASVPAAAATPGSITREAVAGRRRRGGGGSASVSQTTAVSGTEPSTMDGITQDMVDNLLQQGKLQEEAGLEAAALYERLAQDQAQRRQEAMNQFELDLEEEDRRLSRIDQEIGVLRGMTFDASRLFRDRGAGFSMALGVAVGAAQQTMQSILYPGSNPTNTALALVNDAIGRDIREQSVNWQRQQAALGAQNTAYGLARQLTQDHATAAAFAEATAKETAATELSATAMRTRGQQARLRLEFMADEIRSQAEAQKQTALMQMAELMNRNRARASAPTSAFGQEGSGIAPFLRIAPGANRDLVADAFGGASGFRQIQEEARTVSSYVRLVDEIRRLAQQGDQAVLGYNRIGALAAQAMMKLNQGSGLGALDAGSLPLLERALPNPNSVRSIAEYREFLNIIAQSRATSVAQMRSLAERDSGGTLVYDPQFHTGIEAAEPPPPGTEVADTPPTAEGFQYPSVGEFLTGAVLNTLPGSLDTPEVEAEIRRRYSGTDE